MKCLFMNNGPPSSTHRASTLQAKIGFRCAQMSASKLLSTNITLWEGPLLPFARTPLLMLLGVALTRRWGHFSVHLGSLMSSIMAMCF